MSNAGKGDRPRQVVRQTYENNHDNIFARKTWQEWSKQFGDIILDADGFDRADDSKKYSLNEYRTGVIHCTTKLRINARL